MGIVPDMLNSPACIKGRIFVGEKFFFVLLPDLITGGARVSSRFAQAQNRGRGNVGWKRLKNVKVKNIR